MTVTEYYRSTIRNPQRTEDFELFQFRDGFNIGFDSDGNFCIVIKSSNEVQNPLLQRTRLLSVECNRQITYFVDGRRHTSRVHIIRCFSTIERERELFLELVEATFNSSVTDEEVVEVFQILSRFFADKSEPSDIELIGLYAELDAIRAFSPTISIENYWQSKDRMKFDFSFTDELKLEVKATTKRFRTHHFRHEQLVTDMYKIIVLSYLLRHDDEGLSLYELIQDVKPILARSPQKLLRIDRILKNVSEDRLKELKFSPEFTAENRHFYIANLIPSFAEVTPDGVANAEYDCDLENLPYLSDEDFILAVKEAVEAEVEHE